MRSAPPYSVTALATRRGVTLVELLVFIVIISVALVVMLRVLAFQVVHSVDPVAQVKAMEKGQALLDEILSRKFDEATPTGGVPACDTSLTPGQPGACAGIAPDAAYDDVGDYNDYEDSDPTYPASVTVTEAGDDLGIPTSSARLITVSVGVPGGGTVNLSAYRTNF